MPDSTYQAKTLINIYRGAVKNVPILKYSWILIVAICILALAAYFKLKNSDVFGYALALIVISFMGFLFSFLLKTKDFIVRSLLYFLIGSIVLTMSVIIISFASFIIFKKPDFFNRWFPESTYNQSNDVRIKNHQITPAQTPDSADSDSFKRNSDSFTASAPQRLLYNLDEKEKVKIIFRSREWKIKDTITISKKLTAKDFLDNLVDNYKLYSLIKPSFMDTMLGYEKGKLILELYHENKAVDAYQIFDQIKKLKWKDYDIVTVKYFFYLPKQLHRANVY